MNASGTNPIHKQIYEVIRVSKFYPALLPLSVMIENVERMLGVTMPPWLREIYLGCNGFSGPTDECYLYPLDGTQGVGEFTDFLRNEDWSPSPQPSVISTHLFSANAKKLAILDGFRGLWM